MLSAQWYVREILDFATLYKQIKASKAAEFFIYRIQNYHEFQLKIPGLFVLAQKHLSFYCIIYQKHSRVSTLKIKALMLNFLYNFRLLI
jgi:hypothetical protein